MFPPEERSIRSMVNFSRQTSHASSTPWITALSGSSECSTCDFVRAITASNGIAQRSLRDIGFAKLKSIAQHRDLARAFAQLLDITFRLLAETFEQQAAIMFRRQDLRAFRVNLSVAHANLIDLIHQLGNEIEMETGAAKGRDLLFGRENDLGVFDRVMEIVFSHCGPR